ncbi:hypothetical protein MCUN1_000416 [Malassezia cuniculi]|uniref:Oxo-4-hydroxy-4-carboxy-5-ureidoimidazoline decarboxylase domain-containing protein n=1 Tax=Malassezia cuniculi TaxID=948313 RepID=A0AAF0EN50_9BASI|nr:hypothetical protein MCUN1_000416 [Malassezia cuniculi]
MIPPSDIPGADARELVPLLEHLLGITSPANELAQQCHDAISDLPDDTKPTTYDGFVDVARFCVEEEPGWSQEEKMQLLHSRQRYAGGDAKTAERLVALNDEYERRFPGLRFVTFEVDRPLKVLADELDGIIEKADSLTVESETERALEMLWDSAVDRATKLEEGAPLDTLSAAPKAPTAAATPATTNESTIPAASPTTTQTSVAAPPDALAAPSAQSSSAPLAAPSTPSAPSTSADTDIPPTSTTSTTLAPPGNTTTTTADGDTSVAETSAEDVLAISHEPAAKESKSALVDQDEPYLPLSAFRALAVASPVLSRFFEHDLAGSFRFEQVHRSSTGGVFAWHAAPVTSGTQSRPESKAAPLMSLFGGGNSLDAHTPASYSRDITTGTRGKVMGFLGGLLGEEGKTRMDALADQVAMRLQTHSVTGPRPSFAKPPPAPEPTKRRPWGLFRGSNTTEQRQETPAEITEESPADSNTHTNLRGSDYAQEGTEAALATLRAANETLVQQRTTFVIDEVQEADAEEDDENERDALIDDALADLSDDQRM